MEGGWGMQGGCGKACSREEFRVADGEGEGEIIERGELKRAQDERVGEGSRSGSGRRTITRTWWGVF